uniref:Uncharacterized protein n=2 Tax=Calcidiscus leptoporus TaxID=127549 RepID=A0A7S0J0R9_9EUKA|mmetsp:Transcript_33096/g.77385  ORF Transcript_33096/g.77385 Transcript_33096/m.77385 type:complete len:117 (+) Transcript_33096:245-595(+)
MRSPSIALNGEVLTAFQNGTLPALPHVQANGSVIMLPPLSFGFFVFPEAAARPCFTELQMLKAKHKVAASADASMKHKHAATSDAAAYWTSWKGGKGKSSTKGPNRRRSHRSVPPS